MNIREERTHMLLERMNPKQREAADDLASKLDDLEIVGESHDTYVFNGDSADGPAVGYINPDGSVEYLTDYHN
jgi:hypothetical protein